MKLKIKKLSEKLIICITIIIGVIVFAIFCWLMISYTKIPSELFGGTNQNYNGEFVKFIATIFGLIIVLFGLWLNYQRTTNLKKQTKNQAKQIQAFVDQNKITEKGKVDERFKNAIEHLGHDKDAIVLGGIYALHRIAQEDKTYRKTVFDILCSYIREKTSSIKDMDEIPENERTLIKPTIVIQTIIDVLFKYKNIQEFYYMGLTADLHGIKCINADLCEAHLECAKLESAHLQGAKLTSAFMECANLYEAHLEGSDLSEAHLEGANLISANIVGASLVQTNLDGAFLDRAHLEGTYLIYAKIRGASLHETYLEGACLHNTNIMGSDISSAHFEGVCSLAYSGYSFANDIKNRINCETEFSTVLQSGLEEETAEFIIENYSKQFKKPEYIDLFKDVIKQAVNIETNIEHDAITGILAQEKADEIIERYNNAMANVPKR